MPHSFSSEALKLLAACHWPGNVRQLQNFVRRVVMFAPAEEISDVHLENYLKEFDETVCP